MNIDFEDPDRQAREARTTARIRDWVQALFSVPPEITIMVTELKCPDPGCPDIETFIAVLWDDKAPLKFRMPCPAAQVTFEQLKARSAELGH